MGNTEYRNLCLFYDYLFQGSKNNPGELGRLGHSCICAWPFVLYGKKEEDNSFKSFNLQEEQKDTLQNYVGNSYGKDLLLEDNLATQIRAHISYGEDKTGKKLLKAMASRDGFVSGTYWKPILFNVSKLTNKDNYEYQVIGSMEWKILGIKLYTESKEFNGKIKLDQ